MELFEKTINTSYVFKGKIINVKIDDVELPNGNKSFREIVEHNGGVCVLPIDENDNIYMVKQFRSPYKEALLEIPAGKKEGDEQPIDCGIRELKEEVGLSEEDVENIELRYICLRNKLGEKAKYITTVVRTGYKFEGNV